MKRDFIALVCFSISYISWGLCLLLSSETRW